MLRALEAEVLSRTGVAVKLGGKTLDGNVATEWPTRVYDASRAPVDPWWGEPAGVETGTDKLRDGASAVRRIMGRVRQAVQHSERRAGCS